MSRPIVIAHHLIWTLYGWWLPNDPRGSTSKFIHSDIIFELGDLHRGRKRIQPASRDIREFYEHVRTRLMFPLFELSSKDMDCVAEAFRTVIAQERYTCYACSVMPDHVHLLIRKHKHSAEDMIAHLQDASRLRLRAARACKADHPVWGGPGWKVFLDHPDDIRRTIRYVEQNPVKIGRPIQRYPF